MSDTKIKVVVGQPWVCSGIRYNYGDICELLTEKEFDIISGDKDKDVHDTKGHGLKLYLADSEEGKAILAEIEASKPKATNNSQESSLEHSSASE